MQGCSLTDKRPVIVLAWRCYGNQQLMRPTTANPLLIQPPHHTAFPAMTGAQRTAGVLNVTWDAHQMATLNVYGRVFGTDLAFINSAPQDTSGNALGPFTVGQTLKIITEVSNSVATRTTAPRTIVIVEPVV